MEAVKLRLRSDLVISEQGGSEERVFVIKDPVFERFFRFKEIEHFIATQFDGNTTVDKTVDKTMERVQERFNVSLSKENLEQFTQRLQNIGLLTEDLNELSPSKHKSRRVMGDMFYLRFKLFNPDRLFDKLLPVVRFLFTPAFLVLSVLVVLWAISVTMSNWMAIRYQFYDLFQVESLLLAWLIMIGVVTLHEFAHGLTCKYFGGHVREIGFMLIYFQPAFYCNVSDAWLFPEKSKRMWVTFAGGYFEIFLWALATLTWRVTAPETSLNHFALIVTTTSAFKMFFNMNPLIKLDGYYLLSDWLDIPNLRQKSSEYLGSKVKQLWTGKNNDSQHNATSSRERRILLAYAILSAIYIYWLLGSIALWFGGYMTYNYKGLGAIVFALIMVVVFRKPLANMFSPALGLFRGGNVMSHIPRPFIWGLAFAILIASLFYIKADLKVSGAFTVLPDHNADIRAEVEGIIDQIYVNEGDFVKTGIPLARLSDKEYIAGLHRVKAEIEAKKAQLRLLEAGPRAEEVRLARTQVGKASELLKIANSKLARDKQLVEKKYISLTEYEQTKELTTVREKELEEAKSKLKMLLAGNRIEEIESLEADIRALQVQEAYLKEQLNSLIVYSPIDGVVTTHKLKEKLGENIKKGELIAEVYKLKNVTAEIAVPEKEIGEIQVGQIVELKAKAYPYVTFIGNVVSIAPVVTKPEQEWATERIVLVTTQLDNTNGLLKPEMTGNAKIYCGEYRLSSLLMRKFVRFFRVEFWSWW